MTVSIYQDDCFNLIQNITSHSIDMILTDPPYNITSMKWDKYIDFEKLWKEYNRVLKPNGIALLFSSGQFTHKLIQTNEKMYKYRLIWKKNVPTGMSSAKHRPMKYYEEICVFYNNKPTYNPIMKPRVGEKKECYNYDHYCGKSNHVNYDKIKKKYDPNWVQPSDILEFNVVPNRKNKLHPTQKPIELLEYLISTYSNEEDVVLDTFMGSGSTGVACQNLNRNFIGIEIDKDYFEIAEKRLNEVLNCRHKKT